MKANKSIKCSKCNRKIKVSSECDAATCYHCLQNVTIKTNQEKEYATSEIKACAFSLPNKRCRIRDSHECIAAQGKKCGYMELSVVRDIGRKCKQCKEPIGPRKQYCDKCLDKRRREKYREQQKEKATK